MRGSGPGWRQERWAGKDKEAGGECSEGGSVGGGCSILSWRTEQAMEGPRKAPEGVLLELSLTEKREWGELQAEGKL